MRIPIIAAALLAAASPAPLPAQGGVNGTVSVPAGIFGGERSRQVLAVQVLLDRAHFSPGVIDGLMGANTRRAIETFQSANGMAVTGMIDSALLRRLRGGNGGAVFTSYTIRQEDVDGPFVDVPASMAGMAKLERVAYERPAELLAEKFHMDLGFLRALNPGADFGSAGTRITVVATGDESLSGSVARVEVDKADESVRAYASDGTLLARYPATIGSATFPSPSGTMQVRAVAPEATYHFDPSGRSWGPERELTIPPGPNNPVGGIWIDLSKDGYGIHGTPEPSLIGKTASHGCVRLTNWDAEELAAAVEKGATVAFV